MTPRLEEMKRRVLRGEHKSFRQDRTIDVTPECDTEGLSWMQSAARLTQRMCEAERVIIEPYENIVFTRTLLRPSMQQLYNRVHLPANIHDLPAQE